MYQDFRQKTLNYITKSQHHYFVIYLSSKNSSTKPILLSFGFEGYQWNQHFFH